MGREIGAVVLAALLVLSGCSSAVAPGGSGSATPTDGGAAPSGTDAASGVGGESASATGSGSGTVSFYISDERNAIGDFAHLNLTVDRVSFRRVGDGGAEDRTETPGTTDAPEPTGTPEPSETPESDDRTETGDDGEAEGTETPDAPEPTETPKPTATGTPEVDERGGDERQGDGNAEWVTREVDAATVDLTELQGENATMVSRFDLPNGTYTEVRLHVTEVNGTLGSGERVRVKLPSNRLRLKERFAVDDGERVRVVFDATVFEAGKSGKYILKPVASESGTDVPIKEVTRDGGREGRLGARFIGAVEPGEAATVRVAREGEPVSGATVEVDDRTYETGSNGTVTFDVPSDAEELEVELSAGDSEAELRRTFGGSDGADGADDGGDGGTSGTTTT